MKIYLHIGTEKTGTTSIQGFLSENRDELRKHKVMYSKVLGDPNNIRLSIALQNEDKIDDSRIYAKLTTAEKILDYRNELKEKLREEISLENPDIWVISSEHLSSRMNTVEEVERLKQFLNDFSDDITVVVYLRRQDKFFESLYSTAIKKGHTLPFNFPEIGRERQDFHYDAMLKQWEEVFGIEQINANIFEKSKLYQGDVISDFIHRLGLPIDTKRSAKKRENTSFGRKKLAFLKNFNQYVPSIVHHHANPLRANIEEILESIDIDDEPVQMSSVEKIDFLKRFEEGNKEVSKRYFNVDNIFDIPANENKEKIDLMISSDETVEITSKLWMKKQQECNDRRFTVNLLQIDLELAKGNLDNALSLSKTFLSQHPNHPRSNYYYAKVLFENGQNKDAVKYCKKAMELNPKNQEFVDLLNKIKKEI